MALKFLSVKSVPQLFWSAPEPFTLKPNPLSVVFLLVGLFLFGLGDALLVNANIGVSPWTVLAQGLTIQSGWGLGFATFIISAVVLGLWIPLRQVPGIGTIANITIISIVLEYAPPMLPTPDTLLWQVVMCVTGVLVTGFGGAIYLIANLGPGPRDGLMTGLQRVTDFPIAYIRIGIEVSVVCLGWLLGGTAGLGTVLFAFGIGPSVAGFMYLVDSWFKAR